MTLAAPGLTSSGTTVTVRTAAAHGRSVGDIVVDLRRRCRRVQRDRSRSRPSRPRARSQYTNAGRRPRQLGRRVVHLHLAVPAPDRRQRLERGRWLRPGLQAPRTSRLRSTESRASPGTVDRRRCRLDGLHGHVRRCVGRGRRGEVSVRQPLMRRLLRVDRGDEPRRGERLLHAEFQRRRLGPDHERR